MWAKRLQNFGNIHEAGFGGGGSESPPPMVAHFYNAYSINESQPYSPFENFNEF